MSEQTLLCHWYGEPIYEETAPREKLIEILKRLAADQQATRERHEGEINTLQTF